MTGDWDRAVAGLQQACRDAFGVAVAYRPSLRNRPELGGREVPVTGILDDRRETLTLMGAGESGIDAVIPRTTLELRPADLGFDPLAGDEATVGGVSYRVREAIPDGAGSTLLILDRLPSP